MDEQTKKDKAQEYVNVCARIGEQTLIILNAEIDIAEMQRKAKDLLKELQDAQPKS